MAAPLRSITMRELKDRFDALKPDELILDVREPEEFAEGHIPGAKNIPHEEVVQHAPELKKYRTLYVHCRSGRRVQLCCAELAQAGLGNIVMIPSGGMPDWIDAGYPVEK